MDGLIAGRMMVMVLVGVSVVGWRWLMMLLRGGCCGNECWYCGCRINVGGWRFGGYDNISLITNYLTN